MSRGSKNLGGMRRERGAEAGLLQRGVDELLVRRAGAQHAAAGNAAAHASLPHPSWYYYYYYFWTLHSGAGRG